MAAKSSAHYGRPLAMALPVRPARAARTSRSGVWARSDCAKEVRHLPDLKPSYLFANPFTVSFFTVAPSGARPSGGQAAPKAVLVHELQHDELCRSLEMEGKAVWMIEVGGCRLWKPHAEPALVENMAIRMGLEPPFPVVGIGQHEGTQPLIANLDSETADAAGAHRHG